MWLCMHVTFKYSLNHKLVFQFLLDVEALTFPFEFDHQSKKLLDMTATLCGNVTTYCDWTTFYLFISSYLSTIDY